MAFLYVGNETSVGGWVSSLCSSQRFVIATDLGHQSIDLLGSVAFGEVTAPIFLRYMRETILVLFGLITAAVGVCLILLSNGSLLLVPGVILAGAGLGPVYPTIMAILIQTYGASASRAITIFFALSSSGGAVIPWFVGHLSNSYGNLRVGLSALSIIMIVMIALQIILISIQRRPMSDKL